MRSAVPETGVINPFVGGRKGRVRCVDSTVSHAGPPPSGGIHPDRACNIQSPGQGRALDWTAVSTHPERDMQVQPPESSPVSNHKPEPEPIRFPIARHRTDPATLKALGDRRDPCCSPRLDDGPPLLHASTTFSPASTRFPRPLLSSCPCMTPATNLKASQRLWPLACPRPPSPAIELHLPQRPPPPRGLSSPANSSIPSGHPTSSLSNPG